MSDANQAEYHALRDTIRERGTVRLCAVLAGLASWGALAIALHIGGPGGGIALVPFVVLVATFEINFFIHTGVERIGRYLQVFYEERPGTVGWETTIMSYGEKSPPLDDRSGRLEQGRESSGLDPLFAMIFAAAALLNFVNSIAVAERRPAWTALSLVAHVAFAYRIVAARKFARAQRALDLERFRGLLSK